MSELAYNMQGDRFEPPALATYWRVRRLKPGGRGTPDVMFGADGAPLMIAIDTELAEFRKLVNHEPGRYRLDPVDDNHKACEDGCPAYLQIATEAEAPRNAPAPGVTDASANLMEMLVRANTQMVTSIADRFASVMESAAVLLRAADGAGLPAREPMAHAPMQLAGAWQEAELEDETDDADADSGQAQLAQVVQTVADKAMPLLAHTINTKVLGLTPEQSIALMVGGATAPGPSAPPAASNGKADAPAPPRPAAPPANFMMHLAAIEQRLTPEESATARAAIAKMSPETLAAWRKRLIQMSPEEAAAAVRGEVARAATPRPQRANRPSKTTQEAA